MKMDKFRGALQLSAKKEQITFRENAGAGIWVSFLLPLAVIVGGWKSHSHLYKSSAIYSLNLLLNAAHLFYHICKSNSLYVTKRINILCGIASCVTIFFYVTTLHLDFRHSLCYTIANALIYFEGLPFILKVFPSSFTFGEANLTIQALSLFLYTAFTRLNKIIPNAVPPDEYNVCTTILQIGHVGMLLLCIVPFIFKKMRNALGMYMWIPTVIFGFITLSANYILKENAMLWLWYFFTKKERLLIVLLWLVCCIISGMICWHRIRIRKQADTVMRKYFHILGNVVFITGIIFDKNLIYFASGCALAAFILLEMLRVMKIAPLYNFLQNAFILYVDEKDCGIIALTPIYLLMGYSIPLWLHPSIDYSGKDDVTLLSGVLSVGIGDTCASIAGKLFGRRRWLGSKKTVEGTMACACGQAAFVVILQRLGYISLSTLDSFKVLAAIATCSAVEAFTDQIDNIVLPLITYIQLII